MAGNYLDALFGRFYVNGVAQELVGGINVKSPLTATANNETGALDVSLTIEAAAQVPYDNDTSELSAANVQAALDELAAAVDAIGGDLAATGIADVLAVDGDAGGAAARRLVLGSTAATTIPASAENTAIGYSEEIGARRRTGSDAVGVQVFQRVTRTTFDAAALTLTSGGIGASEIPADCMIVAEADVVAVGSVRYAAKLTGTFQVSSGTITKLFDATIGPALPAELSTLHFNITSGAIGVQLVQPSSGPSWTVTTRTTFTVVEDPS